VTRFRNAKAGRVDGHQKSTLLDASDGSEERVELLRTEDIRERLPLFRRGRHLHGPLSTKRDAIEEAKSAEDSSEGAGRKTTVFEKVEEIGADLVRAEQVGGFAEVLGEGRDCADVGLLRAGCEVAHTHVIEHSLT
jgi:hypothetical protein